MTEKGGKSIILSILIRRSSGLLGWQGSLIISHTIKVCSQGVD